MKKWLWCVKSVVAVCLIIISGWQSVWAQSGGMAGNFLTLTHGARAFGLGGNGLAIADDASALYVNPGMLGTISDGQLNATLAKLKFDRRYYDFAFVYPFNALGNFACGWTQLSVDGIVGRDQDGFITNKFSDFQSAFTLGYGRMIGEVFSVGISGKFLYHSLAGYSATGSTIDVGTAIYIGDYLTVAGAFKNIRGNLNWQTKTKYSEAIPTSIGIGAAYYDAFKLKNLMLAADFNLTGSQSSSYHIGAEYIIKDLVIVRSGYSHEGLSLGAGLMYGPLKLDCSYTPEKFSNGARLHFTINWLISPLIAAEPSSEALPPSLIEPPVQQTAEPTLYKETGARQRVVILEGPLKGEQAEVISSDTVNRTITVRLLALPGSEPIVISSDKVKFIEQ